MRTQATMLVHTGSCCGQTRVVPSAPPSTRPSGTRTTAGRTMATIIVSTLKPRTETSVPAGRAATSDRGTSHSSARRAITAATLTETEQTTAGTPVLRTRNQAAITPTRRAGVAHRRASRPGSVCIGRHGFNDSAGKSTRAPVPPSGPGGLEGARRREAPRSGDGVRGLALHGPPVSPRKLWASHHAMSDVVGAPTMTVSDTAQPIAWVRSREADVPEAERLFDDPYAHLFVGAGARSDPARAMLSLPFFATAVRLRTRYLDDAVRTALAEGHRQLVLLGAGFDCRGLRLPEIAAAGARVFEVDFSGQLAHKRQTLDAAGVRIPAHVRYVSCDFASPTLDVELPAGLADAGFETGAGTLFLWEGVVGYLDDAAVAQKLRLVTRVAAPRVRLALNYQLNRFLPADFAARCAAHGLSLVEYIDGIAAYGRYLRGEPPEEATLFRLATASGER